MEILYDHALWVGADHRQGDSDSSQRGVVLDAVGCWLDQHVGGSSRARQLKGGGYPLGYQGPSSGGVGMAETEQIDQHIRTADDRTGPGVGPADLLAVAAAEAQGIENGPGRRQVEGFEGDVVLQR